MGIDATTVDEKKTTTAREREEEAVLPVSVPISVVRVRDAGCIVRVLLALLKMRMMVDNMNALVNVWSGCETIKNGLRRGPQ